MKKGKFSVMDEEPVKCKEIAPCGMKIEYEKDNGTDVIITSDICNKGKYRLSEACERCVWKGICKPTECNYMDILVEYLGRPVDPLEVITQIFKEAASGYEEEIYFSGGYPNQIRRVKRPYGEKRGKEETK